MFALPIPDALPVIAWSAGAMAPDEQGRAVPRLRTAGLARGGGLRPRPGPGARCGRPASRTAPAAPRRPRPLRRSRPAVRRAPPAARRRHLGGLRRRGRRARARPRHTAPSPHGVRVLTANGRCRRWARREQQADGREPAARSAPGRRCGHRPLRRPLRLADHRGRPGDVPVPRRGGRGLRAPPGRRPPDPLEMRRLEGTDLWAATTVLPEGSRVEYQVEVRRGDHHERFNDPSTRGWRTAPSGLELGVRGGGLRGARLGAPRPRGATGRDHRGVAPE